MRCNLDLDSTVEDDNALHLALTDTFDNDNASCAAQAMPSKSKRKRIKQSRIPANDFRHLLQANAQFYSAFSSLDLESMKSVWLKDSRCICQFPGAKRVVGYEKIIKSWKFAVTHMDSATRRNWMEPTEIQVEFQTADKATVFCQENVYSISCSIVEGELRPESQLLTKLSSTNAFKREKGKWYLWYHQASEVNDDVLAESRVLNKQRQKRHEQVKHKQDEKLREIRHQENVLQEKLQQNQNRLQGKPQGEKTPTSGGRKSKKDAPPAGEETEYSNNGYSKTEFSTTQSSSSMSMNSLEGASSVHTPEQCKEFALDCPAMVKRRVACA